MLVGFWTIDTHFDNMAVTPPSPVPLDLDPEDDGFSGSPDFLDLWAQVSWQISWFSHITDRWSVLNTRSLFIWTKPCYQSLVENETSFVRSKMKRVIIFMLVSHTNMLWKFSFFHVNWLLSVLNYIMPFRVSKKIISYINNAFVYYLQGWFCH